MESQECQNKNPLRLNGVAQESRFPKALDPTLVQIDGKTLVDYQTIANEFAKLIQFYNTDNQRDGDWETFFNSSEFANETSKPHIALFHAFIQLMLHAQEDLNLITTKHLEFYYKDALQIAFKDAQPDEAHIVLGLSNNIKSHLVEEGTLLRAGKDKNGKQRLFKTKEDIVVNRTQISELKSVFVEKTFRTVDTPPELLIPPKVLIYSAAVANSLDGLGEPVDESNPKWAQFGQNQAEINTKTMALSKIGLAISSDFLRLNEGTRHVKLVFTFSNTHTITSLDKADFTVCLSGEKKWIETTPTKVEFPTNQLIIEFELAPEIDPIVPYNETVFAENFNCTNPVLKLLINQNETKNVYGQLVDLNLTSVEITATVDGIKQLVIQNDSGKLDPTKPFEPFGARPVLGSTFYVGCQEAFGKKLTALTFDFEWMNQPDFSSYYDVYYSDTSFSDFKINGYALRNRIWNSSTLNSDGVNLFQSDTDPKNKMIFDNVGTVFSEPDPVSDFVEFTNQQKNGFVKLELVGPNFTTLKAFGHGDYQNLYVKKATSLALGVTETILPNEPYTPKAKSFYIGYSATELIPLTAPSDSVSQHFFHIGAFGVANQTSFLADAATLVPKYEDEGNFYIGITNAEPPQNLSLLFQVSEGSADPNKLPEKIKWSYLINNTWQDFTGEIISDSTNGFVNSGIISFPLPKELNKNNTWLTPDKYWIKASIAENSDSVCQVINVHPQAITAVFSDNGNELSHLAEPLEANTIAKLSQSQAVIKSVEQPYATFNGKLPEEGNDYYRRVSERLRHKNRPITIWDFERIVLEEFPSVYKLKCLNHTRMNENYSEQAPGNVSLIVISNLRNQNAVNPLQPTTSLSTLTAIKSFLTPLKNPFIELHIKNPTFEEVQVEFNVRFYEGTDESYYQNQLNEDLKKYLSPWAYADGVDISFEGVIHKSKIINFVEELAYVDYVTCFKMYHIINQNVTEQIDVNEISPTRSSALVVSATQHLIYVLTTEECECDTENVQVIVVSGGIGTMEINQDFEVNKI
jgi:hypothetical protein